MYPLPNVSVCREIGSIIKTATATAFTSIVEVAPSRQMLPFVRIIEGSASSYRDAQPLVKHILLC